MKLRFYTTLNKFLFGFEVHREPALFILRLVIFEVVFNWNEDKLSNFNTSNRKWVGHYQVN